VSARLAGLGVRAGHPVALVLGFDGQNASVVLGAG
jgi:hypothetical protein